jgi:hypothetical protein
LTLLCVRTANADANNAVGAGVSIIGALESSASPSGPASAPCRVSQHADAFHGDKRSTCDHLVEDREQTIDMLLIVYDLDHYRQVRRQLDQAGRVNHAVRAETGDSMNDRRASKAFRAQSFEERASQRRVMPLVRFTEKDANEELIAVEYAHD